MKALAFNRYLAASLAVIVVANAVALAGAAYNRSGEPESTLQLTERELVLMPPALDARRENSGIELYLRWSALGKNQRNEFPPHVSVNSGASAEVFDDKKLQALGFDTEAAIKAARNRDDRYSPLPREAYVVLELDGPVYRAYLDRWHRYIERQAASAPTPQVADPEKAARDQFDRVIYQTSRLFAIDAGLEKDALRRQYPDNSRYAILRGQVRMRVENGVAHGGVTNIRVNRISVPAQFRPAFAPVLRGGVSYRQHEIFKLDATVAFGQRLEPWVVAASGRKGTKYAKDRKVD